MNFTTVQDIHILQTVIVIEIMYQKDGPMKIMATKTIQQCNMSPLFLCSLLARIMVEQSASSLFTPPARRAWRSFKFASLNFSVLFSVSQVGLPLMGDTAADIAYGLRKTHCF